ncbi:hypothetical protein L484_015132 [Morus notabilis]|uniref:Uncharacterized protein n=1 Tax=Morus notabilis TaxID=981085 RepID=W9SVI0_9ROSA|nr:hypothetical protein L484_015132 [Morus notabilis]
MDSSEPARVKTDPLDSSSAFQKLLDLLNRRFDDIEGFIGDLDQTGRNNSAANSTARTSNNFVNTIITISKEKDIDVPISVFKVCDSLNFRETRSLCPSANRLRTYPSLEAQASIHADVQDMEDVLACVVAVDGLFLLNLLCSYGNNKEVLASSSSLRHLVKISQRRLAQETTIQVAMMLENQIPIFVLKFILFIECWKEEYSGQREIVSDLLPRILLGFCEFVSPLKTVENYPLYRIIKHSHLLDLLYHLVTLKQSPEWNPREEEKEESSLKALSHKVRLKIAHLLVSDSKVRFQPIDSRIIEAAKKLAPSHLQKPIDLVQEPPILNWYVEFMNGLIQTAEDVTVLKKQKIISESKSINDERIAKIFSGMNKSVELTNIPKNLNDAIGGVKEYYDHVWWVSSLKFMKKCWWTTRKWCNVIAVLLVLFLLAVQTFCSVYECPRFSFKINNASQAQQGLRLPSLRSHL